REAGSKFDITLYATDDNEGIKLELLYNTDLFDQARILAMLRQFAHLASQVLNVEAKIAGFSLVAPVERGFLPDPTAPLSDHWVGSVQELFAQQAQRMPDNLAVMDATESISYQELDALSNRLAHYLCASGIITGDVVAIYAHRSLPLVAAVFGVLKAGATCLILDPAYPPARLIEYMAAVNLRGWLHIQAAGPLPTALEAFLTTSVCRCRFELPRRVSDLHAVLATYSPRSVGVEVGPDDLAFVTFTSGSTGQPKGVLQRHGPLSHFLPWQQQRFGFREEERYSLLSGLAHDPLQREIFTPLCLGGTICIPSPEYTGSPGYLAEWMQQQAINIAQFTPAMLQLLTQSASDVAAPVTLPALRYAFMVGEALTRREVARLYALAPSVTCVNFYGSTETHRALGYFVIPRAEILASQNAQSARTTREIIPLGQGIQDTQLLVLNDARQVAAISELGELYIRSPHLAAGYLNDAPLTGERFIINPFTAIASDRLYRTGDLGRYRPDGNVEYAGRNDQQVNLRGFRIELAEIEAVLGLHPAVREAVVMLREDTPEQKRLVAYVVPAQTHSHASLSSELRDFLTTRLPAYMLPSVFVPLDSLPLTPNRKVDRRALPAPESVLPTFEPAGAPRTPMEEILVGIWARMLGREQVGINDNFFDLGGHSLLATQLLARIDEAFQQKVSLRTLFETPTIAGLAAYLERHRTGKTNHRRQTIRPLSSRLSESYQGNTSPEQSADFSFDRSLLSSARYMFPLSFAQERLWFLDQLDPGNAAYTISAQLHIEGKLLVKALQDSVHALVQRHANLRTTFVTLQGHPEQAIASSLNVPLSVLDFSELHGAEQQSQVQHCLQEEAQRSFDLARGPLFSLILLRLGSEDHLC
ncbi:MAG TPA: amino acid adenylation domain-containing protein, partial [Ktedonobacteraceae bacterium]|nr:amino acid adenylation domain-containing protein [Ktedonobacteraceae bacterium]